MTPEEAKEYRRRNVPSLAITHGCSIHSLEDVRHGLRLAEQKTPADYPRMLSLAVSSSMRNEAPDITLYLITEENAPLSTVTSSMLASCRSLPLWSALIERGWDINQRSRHGMNRLGQRQTLLEFICHHDDLVHWCLDHGATVDDPNIHDEHPDPDLEEDPSLFDVIYPPVLEEVAWKGSISTFKLLREKYGARIGRRTLHFAAERAATLKDASSMDMLRYLVDEVGLDVNQMDADRSIPMHLGTPLHYAIEGPQLRYSMTNAEQSVKVVRFLLERGADPYQPSHGSSRDAFGAAEYYKNEGVLRVLHEWKEEHKEKV